MALPSSAITRLDLSATFEEFDLALSRNQFIGATVFRPVEVAAQAADVGKVPIEALLKEHETRRSPGAAYNRSDFEFTTFSYATQEHGWEEVIDDRTLKTFGDIIRIEPIKTQRAIDMVLRKYEIDAATVLYDTAVWTGASLTTAVSNPWSTVASGTPIADVHAAKEKVRLGSGLEANALICNRTQFWEAFKTDEVTNLIKYWGGDDPKKVSEATLAAAMDLDYVIVAGGIRDTGKQGQDVSISSIWSDTYAMVCRIATTADPQEPCVARSFIFSEDGPAAPGGGGQFATIVEEYREENRRGGVIRARTDYDQVVMYKEAGHLLSSVS